MILVKSSKKISRNFKTRHDSDIILEPQNICNKRKMTRSKSFIVTSVHYLINQIFQLTWFRALWMLNFIRMQCAFFTLNSVTFFILINKKMRSTTLNTVIIVLLWSYVLFYWQYPSDFAKRWFILQLNRFLYCIRLALKIEL